MTSPQVCDLKSRAVSAFAVSARSFPLVPVSRHVYLDSARGQHQQLKNGHQRARTATNGKNHRRNGRSGVAQTGDEKILILDGPTLTPQ
jgi:hypothetical protein